MLDNCGVKSRDNPTVPKADTSSNPNSITLISSSQINKNNTTATYIIDIKTITIALLYIFQLILLLLYSRCSLFFIVVTIPKSINPAVVVFIPPPVEPGEAPININTTNRKTVCS